MTLKPSRIEVIMKIKVSLSEDNRSKTETALKQIPQVRKVLHQDAEWDYEIHLELTDFSEHYPIMKRILQDILPHALDVKTTVRER